jgi:hypothetical protein
VQTVCAPPWAAWACLSTCQAGSFDKNAAGAQPMLFGGLPEGEFLLAGAHYTRLM